MLIFLALVCFTLACVIILLTEMRARGKRASRSQRKLLHYYQMAQAAEGDHDLAWRDYWMGRALREKGKKR